MIFPIDQLENKGEKVSEKNPHEGNVPSLGETVLAVVDFDKAQDSDARHAK